MPVKMLKRTVKCLLDILLTPICFVLMALTKIVGFHHMSAFISLIPFQIGERLRCAYYGWMLLEVGKNVVFRFGCHFSYREIRIGSNTLIGYWCMVGLCDIGDDVVIGSHCSFLSGGRMHGIERMDVPIRTQPGRLQRIKIGNDVWIGTRVILMADVNDGCVVGSGAVVTKTVAPSTVVAGNPAKVLRYRGKK